MLRMLHEFATEIAAETVLFADAWPTQLPCPQGTVFRQRKDTAELPIFPHHVEPEGDWLLENDGAVIATGGFLTHYNPPYGDLYMEVLDSQRQRGFGSYLIQELKKVCYAAGKVPAARCGIDNQASRRTLEKAGMLACGHLLTGRLR
jgi:GNAT superfamily N-acetyltransferase